MLRSSPILVVVALCSMVSPAAASLIVTYELEGGFEVSTPGGLSTDPLTGTGETPTWSTGTFTNDLGVSNTSTSLNGTPLPGPPYDGMVSYTTAPELTTNSITLFFPDADAGLGLEGIGEGIVEIISLEFFYRVRSDPAFDALLSVQGLVDNDFAGGVGHLNAAGVVDSWSSDSVGLSHSELMCAGTICSSSGLTPGNLAIVHDTAASISIDLSGEFPASPAFPASAGLTFSPDFQSLSFESGSLPLGGTSDRSRLVFQGTVSAVVPEPSTGLLVGLGLTLLGLWRTRAETTA